MAKVLRWLWRGGALVRYAVVGISTSGLDLLLFAMPSSVWRWPLAIASAISSGIAVFVAYILNRTVVFDSDQPFLSTLAVFAGTTLTITLINQMVMMAVLARLAQSWGWTVEPGWTTVLMKGMTISLGGMANYVASLLIFRSRGSSTGGSSGGSSQITPAPVGVAGHEEKGSVQEPFVWHAAATGVPEWGSLSGVLVGKR